MYGVMHTPNRPMTGQEPRFGWFWNKKLKVTLTKPESEAKTSSETQVAKPEPVWIDQPELAIEVMDKLLNNLDNYEVYVDGNIEFQPKKKEWFQNSHSPLRIRSGTIVLTPKSEILTSDSSTVRSITFEKTAEHTPHLIIEMKEDLVPSAQTMDSESSPFEFKPGKRYKIETSNENLAFKPLEKKLSNLDDRLFKSIEHAQKKAKEDAEKARISQNEALKAQARIKYDVDNIKF